MARIKLQNMENMNFLNTCIYQTLKYIYYQQYNTYITTMLYLKIKIQN